MARIKFKSATELSKMKYNELRKYVTKLKTRALKQITLIKNKGLEQLSVATTNLEHNLKGLGMSRSDLLRKAAYYKKFFESKTSTIKGIKNYNKILLKKIKNPADLSRFWRLYHQYEQMEGVLFKYFNSDQIQEQLSNIFVKNINKDDATILKEFKVGFENYLKNY